MAIGSLGLSAVATLITAQAPKTYTQASQVPKPSLLRAVAFRRAARTTQDPTQKPNIMFIMGDDIGRMQPNATIAV